MTPQHDIIPYWQRLGATHAGLVQAQRHKAQVIASFQPIRYRLVLQAYLRAFAGAITKIEQAITKIEQAIAEREHIARRHRPD